MRDIYLVKTLNVKAVFTLVYTDHLEWMPG